MEALQELLQNRIKAANKEVWLTNQYKTLKTDEEFIISTFDVMQSFNVVPIANVVSKNNGESRKLREQGNELYITKSLNGSECIKILVLYTKSIAYASPGSPELALAYANRSAVLLKIHKYTECIGDIDRALSLDYPDNLKIKLYMRKLECLVSMRESSIEEDYKTAMHWLEKISLDDPNKKKFETKLQYLYGKSKSMIKRNSETQKKKNFLLTKKSENIEIPCASDAVAIKYNEKYGRHVVATRDIGVGEVIVLEKPYSFILNPDNVRTHCFNCLAISWANIPCDYCVNIMYCSEQCKLENWKKFHDIECPVFSVLFETSDYVKFDAFSLRMTIQVIREFNSLDDLRCHLKEIDKCDDPRTKGFSSDKKFHSDKYTSVYTLATNTDRRPMRDLFRRAVDACTILYLLGTHTTIFGDKLPQDLNKISKNSDATFVGGLIFRHQQLIPTNGHSCAEEHFFGARERAVVLLPFCSLLNHSCDPNVLRHSKSNDTVMFAIYPIYEGEQIFDNYGEHYAVTSIETRHQKLLKQYYFDCECIACINKWPEFFYLPSFQDIIGTRNQSAWNTVKALQKFNHYVTVASAGDIDDEPYIVEDLFKMMEVLYDNVTMPCREMNGVLETLKRVLGLISNRFEVPIV